jgi:osmotically-inducible protein OsmY
MKMLIVCGLSGLAMGVGAQSAAVPVSPYDSVSTAAPAPRSPGAAADEELRKHVEAALQADPYFNDAHVTVSVEKGAVVLRGFVFSAWDLTDAVRIARKVAGGRRVINDLSIQLGGRR